MTTEKYDITGMGCAACSARIEKGLSKMEEVAEVSVNLLTNSMILTYDNSRISSDDIIAKVENLGYGAALRTDHRVTSESEIKDSKEETGSWENECRFTAEIGEKSTTAKGKTTSAEKMGTAETVKGIADSAGKNHEDRKQMSVAEVQEMILRYRLIISLIFGIPLFLIAMIMPVHNAVIAGLTSVFKLPELIKTAYLCIELMLAGPIVGVNFEFYKVGIPMLIRRAPNMDSLIAVGTIASAAIGYFDSVGMILTLVTFGKYLETRAKRKTTGALTGLMQLLPDTAAVIRDGEELTVKTTVIRKGETIVCRPGETIAVDGVVTEGRTNVNRSAFTGESRPTEVGVGDKVIGGTINIDGYIKYEATEVGQDTVLSEIIRLVEDAASSKAPIARIADRIAGVFVPAVMGIALVTLVLWLAFGDNAGVGIVQALNFAVSVLVISCPCAMGLATPVAIMAGMGKGASEGIIIKSAAVLEKLGKVDTVVFDKTGTITEGIVSETRTLEERMDGDRTIVNTEGDRIRSEAPEVIEELKKMGITCVLLSGDRDEYAAGVAEEVGIEKYYSEVFPGDKEAVVRELQEGECRENAGKEYQNRRDKEYTGKEPEKGKNKRLVAMVGDGVNDAPAITRADVGIAVGSGTDIAIDAADMVLMGDGIGEVVKAVKLSRATVKNIKLGLFWAFFYNIICIPLAAGVLYPAFGIALSPMIGAACMSLSSVTVCANALRLRGLKL